MSLRSVELSEARGGGLPEAPELDRGGPPRRAIDACRAVTERHARTFSLAAHLLPRSPRAAAYAVYAFCRRADDAVDAAPGPDQARAALEEARARLARVYGPTAPVGPDAPSVDDLELAGLAWAVRRYRIPRAPLEQLLDGMAMDLQPLRLESWAALHRYCVLAAGTVGRALAPALGAGPGAGDAAEALGVALQLTNILRDVDEDLARGRIYLAEDELVAHGLSHRLLEALRAAVAQPPGDAAGAAAIAALRARFRGYMAAQVDRARAWYARAEAGLPLIASVRARLCVRAMAVLYGEILAELERRALDPFSGRARVPLLRKLWLLAGCLLGRGLPRPKLRSGTGAPLLLPPAG